MEGLVVQLDNYSRLGIPKLQHLTAAPDPAEDLVEEALYSLEDNWTDIVEKSAGLSERLKAQQTALWELISTELAFIRTLKVIQDVSVDIYILSCLLKSPLGSRKYCPVRSVVSGPLSLQTNVLSDSQ